MESTALTVADLPTGTIARIQPLAQYPRIPVGPAVILGSFGPLETATMVLAWYWGMGEPDAGRTVHAIFPREVTVQSTTLMTLPEGAFTAMAQALARPLRIVREELDPLATTLRTVAAERGLRV